MRCERFIGHEGKTRVFDWLCDKGVELRDLACHWLPGIGFGWIN